MLTVGSLFSGIGGFDIGLERAGMRVIWNSEIDPYASAVLRKHWPHVPNHGDIRSIRNVERPDVLCGGFPCQPHSLSGKRLAGNDERDLWGEYERVIGELRPRFVLAENVLGLLSSESGRFFGRVLRDLATLGYDAEWHCLPATVAAHPHRRERIIIMAHAGGEGLQAGRQVPIRAVALQSLLASSSNHRAVAGRGQPQRTWEEPRLVESPMGSATDGVPARLVRSANAGALRCLGNAIVPQIAEIIGRAIVKDATPGEGK